MTRIKRKTFIIKRFTRITEQTYLQKKQNIATFQLPDCQPPVSKTTAGNRIFTDRNKADLYSLFINVLHAKGRFSKEYFYNLKKSVMIVEKFKVLLYLKKSEPDKTGKARSWYGSPSTARWRSSAASSPVPPGYGTRVRAD